VCGKFLFLGDEKLYLRGVTYGTFARHGRSGGYPPPAVVAADFADMAANGINAIRTYTVPPGWLLDIALERGLWVMVGVAWEQHVAFLDGRGRGRSIEARVRGGVAACAGHPAVLCYAIGNEIPARVVRWMGRRRVERFLERLHRAARDEDPDGLVTYVNYPTTEYLQSPSSDLVCFNVYLETRDRLDAYLARLQNVAGDRPLVMTEFGLDSRGHGRRRQAEVLDWQIRTAFERGCAGAFVFSWTDEWHVSYLSETGDSNGSVELLDWDFGLTDRDRRPKPALTSVRRAYSQAPFSTARRWPRASVVVCSFNGARTLGRCLEHVERLDYPDFEVVVVDDGSTDETPTIAEGHACRLISTHNQGLACARNTGLREATGEVIAYLDDDAYPDPHWLRYLVAAMEDGGYAGVGGPNLPPADDCTIARCVAEAPGGPIHVLLSDRDAEHIPGCNMAFRRESLDAVGGFDPQFRVAGDDVDVCWRLRDAGCALGFSPAAIVWHARRNSVRAYLRQQRGYGGAEALLERKWPDRYGPDGHARWMGRLYGHGLASAFGRWRVYYGTWGSEPFQSLYGPVPGALSSLVARPAWHAVLIALAALSAAGISWPPLLLAVPLLVAALVVSLLPGARSAARGSFMREPIPRRRRLRMWALTTVLHAAQPLARLRGRARMPSWRRAMVHRAALPRPRTIVSWSERWRSAEDRLADVERGLRGDGVPVFAANAFRRWDLQARCGLLGSARLRLGLEEHGAGRQVVRVRISPAVAPAVAGSAVVLAVAAVGAALAGAWRAEVVVGIAMVVLVAWVARECGLAVGSFVHHVSPPAESATHGTRTIPVEET
jgi:GT2 family glycosyltransferase